MRKKNPPKQNVWLIQDLYHVKCYVTESIVNTLQAEKLETLIYQVGAISWSGKVSLGRTNGGRHTWHLNACPIVKKNLINQSVRRLPPFSQSNKIKSWKGEDTITAFTQKSLKIRSVGEKKGGGGGWNIPLLNWVNVFSTVYGDKISICFSLIIFLWQL